MMEEMVEAEQLTLPQLEKMVKQFKAHRSAIDFDKGFIHAVCKEFESRE